MTGEEFKHTWCMKLRMLLAVAEIKAALLDRAVAMSSGFSLWVIMEIMVKIDTRWHARPFFTLFYVYTFTLHMYLSVPPLITGTFFTE